MQGVQKVETFYDDTDINVISQNFYNWNAATKNWDLTENDVIEYDASGNRTVGYINWNDSVLDLFRTYIEVHYEFDKNNYPVKEEEYDWSNVTGQLELAYKTEYFFYWESISKVVFEARKWCLAIYEQICNNLPT
jgi:hypothetical protein